MYQIPRSGKKKGGVAVLYNTALNVKLVKVDRSITTFELIQCDVSAQCVSPFSTLCNLPSTTIQVQQY